MKLTRQKLKEFIEEELVAVKGGLGSMRLDQVQLGVKRMLEDLLTRAEAGEYHTIGKNEFDVLANMWSTVSNAIPRDVSEERGSINLKDLGAKLIGDDAAVTRNLKKLSDQLAGLERGLGELKDMLAAQTPREESPPPTEEDPTGSGSD